MSELSALVKERFGLTYNLALVESMAHFADAVWAIDINSEELLVIHDDITPDNKYRVMTLADARQLVIDDNDDEIAEKFVEQLTREYLSTLKESETYESTSFKKGDETHFLRHVMTPEFDNEGKVVRVYVTFVDVETQIAADKINATNKTQISRIMNALGNTSISSFLYVPRTKKIKMSPMVCEIYGLNDIYDNAPYSFLDEYVYEPDRENVIDAFNRIDAGDLSATVRFHNRNRSEYLRITMTTVKNYPDGSPRDVFGIVENDTEFSEAIEERNKYRDELNRYLGALSCGILQYNKRTKEIIFVNDIALKLFGFNSTEELISSGFDGVIATVFADDAEKIQRIVDGLTPKDPAVDCEYKVRLKNGDVKTCYGTIRIINVDGEEIVQRSMIDITELKMASNELKVINALSALYFVVYQIDLVRDTFEVISMTDDYGDKLKNQYGIQGIASTTMDTFTNSMQDVFSKKDMKKFCDFKTLPMRLKNEPYLSMEFFGVSRGHCRASFISSEYDSEGNPTKAVFLISDINQEKHREEKYIREIKTHAERSQEFFSMLNNLVGCATWYVSYDIDGSLKSITWGNAMRKMLGYETEEEFPDVFDSFSKAIHPDDIDEVISNWSGAIFANDAFDVRTRVRSKDGIYQWYRSQGTVLHHENGQPRLFFGTFVNINDQVWAEEKAHAAEVATKREAIRARRNLDIVNEIAGTGFWYCDFNSIGEIIKVFWSRKFRELIGYSIEEFPNELNSWISIIHPDDKEMAISAFKDGIKGTGIQSVKFRCRMKNGEYNLFQATAICDKTEDGLPRLYAGTMMNITYAEKEASDAAGRLDTLLGGVNGGIKISKNEHNYPYTYISESVAEIQGYTPDELMVISGGNTFGNIYKEDFGRIIEGYIKEFNETGSFSVKYRVRHKDGHLIWVHDYGKKVVNPDGSEFVYSLIQNIDRQESAVERLDIERNTFREALTKHCFYSCDVDLTDGFFREEIYLQGVIPLFASTNMTLPVSFDDQIKHTIDIMECDFSDEISRKACTREGLLEFFEKGETQVECHVFSNEKNIYSRLLFLMSKNPRDEHIHAFIIVQDESESRRKELVQQRELETNLAKIKRSARVIDALSQDYANVYIAYEKDALVEVRKQNGLVVADMSDGVQRLFPYDVLWRKYISMAVHPDDQKWLYEECKLPKVVEKLNELSEYEGTYRTVNTGLEYYQFKFVRIDVDEIICGFRRVSSIVKKEQEQRKLIEDSLASAEYANRAKTLFLNSMSHDIRTPMNAIVGYTSLAESNLDDKEKVRDYLGKIKTSSDHLLGLINDVLDMSRIESGKVSLTETPESIISIMNDVKNIEAADINDKKIKLLFNLFEISDEVVYCDSTRLRRILINCLGNAVKFTPEGGHIGFEVTQLPDRSIEYSTYVFKIKDNGIGMSKEFVEHIFEPFSREKTATVSGIQGTGLGMSITKSFVDLMGGNIEVESELGKGTTITITFTFRTSASELVSSSRKESSEPDMDSLAGLSILLAEDNELNREIACEILSMYGATVEPVDDGIHVVEILKNAPDDKFNLVLMDIQMPVMNGYEATKRVRTFSNSYSEIPIIAMTANAFEEDKLKAIDSGMNAHISKPINVSELVDVILKFI